MPRHGLYMICTLSKQAEKEGFHDALMLDRGQAEATGVNIFLMDDDRLHANPGLLSAPPGAR